MAFSYLCSILDKQAGLKYEEDDVEMLYIVPVHMYITTSDDFWQTGAVTVTNVVIRW